MQSPAAAAQGARVALSPNSAASHHPLCRQTPVIDQLAKALVNLARSRCVGHALSQRSAPPQFDDEEEEVERSCSAAAVNSAPWPLQGIIK